MPLQQNCTVPSMLNSLILHVQEPLVMKQILLVGVVMFTSVSFCLYMFFFFKLFLRELMHVYILLWKLNQSLTFEP